MGVDPLKWGPGAWRFLHHLTLSLPDHPSEASAKAYTSLFRLLPSVLPCAGCRAHLRTTYRAIPFPGVSQRGSLVQWLSAVHARTNKDLHKRVRAPPLHLQVAGFRAGWRAGLRDLAFSIALNLPSTKVPSRVRRFLTACRSIVGSHQFPSIANARSKATLLNTLAAFYKVGKKKVLRKYRPWLSSGAPPWQSAASTIRSKPSSNKKGQCSSRTPHRKKT